MPGPAVRYSSAAGCPDPRSPPSCGRPPPHARCAISGCRRAALPPRAARRRSRRRRTDRRPRRSGRRDAAPCGTGWRDPRADRGLSSTIVCCSSIAAVRASTALENSTSTPSPVSLTMRPPRRASSGTSCCFRMARRRATVPLSSRPIESGVADHVGSQDSRQSSLVTGQCNFPNSPYRIVEALARLGNEMAGHVTTGREQWPARQMSALGRFCCRSLLRRTMNGDSVSAERFSAETGNDGSAQPGSRAAFLLVLPC